MTPARRGLRLLAAVVTVALLLATPAAANQRGSTMSLWDEGQAAARAHVDGRYAQLLAEVERLRAELEQAQRDLAAAQQERDARVGELTTELAKRDAEIARLQKLLEAPTQQPTAGLWWQRPTNTDPDRMLLAHYVPWMPAVGVNNENQPMGSDYYSRAWLAVQGENGTHAAYGGRIRNAPYHDAPYDAPYRVLAARDEIAIATRYGLDGFFVDLVATSTTHSHWPAVQALLDAAPEHPGFRIVPMVDTNGSGMTNAADSTVAAHLERFLSRPSAWRLADGRYVVGIFKVEGWTAARWANLAAELAKLGRPVAFVGSFVDIDEASKYPGLYSVGQWGGGSDPALLQGAATGASAARTRGQRVLMPLLGQNVRPAQGWYDEARGLGALVASWDQIMRESATQAPIVQMVTWNDYAEGSDFGPSRGKGTAALAYSAWRADQWRSGPLEILVDTVIVSHRDQLVGAEIVNGRRMVMAGTMVNGKPVGPTRPRQSPSVDEISVLTLLTAPATVRVLSGSLVTEYDTPAGEHLHYAPAGAGRVIVTVLSAERIDLVSPIEIRSRSGNHNPVWYHIWDDDPIDVTDPTPAA